MLDKLSLGLLVSRNNVPIFANRYLLDMLGFKDEDALHDAGGMTHLFGGLPGNATGSEAVGISEIDGGYLADSIAGGTSTSYTLSTLPDGRPLVDGHQYAVAVAAFDDTGNVGLVSNLACQAPAAVVDFFNAYGSAGGGAGGGFCSLQAPGAPAFGSALGTVLGVAAVAFVRRRRRRR